MPKPGSSLVTEYKFFYGYVVVAASFLIMVVIWAAYYSFGVFFKPLITDFGWTRAATSGAFSLSAIINGLLAIVMGKLVDRFGPRIVMTICAILIGSGFMLMSGIASIWQVYLFYGLIVGVGMGGSFVPVMSTVVRWFYEKRSMMTGIVAAGMGIGALIGPPIAHQLIIHFGWRKSYVIFGATVFSTVILVAQLIKRDPSEVGQHAYGETKIDAQLATKPSSKALSFREAIYTRQFWIVYCMFFCLGFCTFAVMVHMAPHAIELEIPAAVAANILATVGGLSIIARILMGRAADIIGSKRSFIIGFMLMFSALFGLVPFKMIWILFVLAGVFGFANGSCVSSQSPLVALLFGLSSHGVILGFLSFGFTTGGAFGPWLAGYIFDATDSYRLAFLMCAGVSLTGLILTMFLKPKKITL
jgi:MFS family permease